MSSDLTVIYLTVNKMPRKWVQFHLGHLLLATEGRPMIVISAKPIEDERLAKRPATAFLTQEPPFCAWQVYRQLLRGASLAETKYIAVAEDDSLYPARHFNDFRPKDDEISYDQSRWSVFSWQENPFFSAIRKNGNFMMLGSRQLVVDALEEREEKHPAGAADGLAGEIGRPDVERRLGVRRNKLVQWWAIEPTVNLAHPEGLSPTFVNRRGLERKPGELKSLECPIWGRASKIAAVYNEGVAEDAAQSTHAP